MFKTTIDPSRPISTTQIVQTKRRGWVNCCLSHCVTCLRQQLTRPRRSQPHRSCKRNDTKPDCDSAIAQHLSENYQCALNYDNKRFSILATARSSFHLNLLEQACTTQNSTRAISTKKYLSRASCYGLAIVT